MKSAMSISPGPVRETRPAHKDYRRVTPVGDGRYDVSTISGGLLARTPDTCIFDNPTGDSWVVETHADHGDESLDEAHLDALRRFAGGEYAEAMVT